MAEAQAPKDLQHSVIRIDEDNFAHDPQQNQNNGGGSESCCTASGGFRRGCPGGRGRNRQNDFEKRKFDDLKNHPSSHGFGAVGDGGFNPKFYDRLRTLSQPTIDLPPLDTSEKKFNGRNRLYVGSIGPDCSEEILKELFSRYGEINEVFINREKNFGFLRLDYRVNAERAKKDLDGKLFKGRYLRVRFAPPNASIKVRNLPGFVTNELLHHAFSVFGEIERATVFVDEKGKPTGEAVVDFLRKGSAMHAYRQCKEVPFFLTASLRPCVIENFDIADEWEGFPETYLSKRNQEYIKMRSVGPHFASMDSFEYELGNRYKEIYELYDKKLKALKTELEMDLEKIDAQMEFARYEHETERLKREIQQREERNKTNFKRNFNHRRQDSHFWQANQFNDSFNQAENALDQSLPFSGNNRGFNSRPLGPHGGGNRGGGGSGYGSRYNNNNRRDDNGLKRRCM